MGKDEEASEENSDEENSDPKEEITEEETKEETGENPAEAKPEQKEDKPTDEKEKNAEALRKVIKVGSKEGEDKKPDTVEEENPVDDTGGSASRESLEQKRAILQSIKDFDFQIKKNQEGISGVNKKLEGMTKDLDDLVSLYEIVSEQMNPFVGISKVTKKRLDALENFTKEIDLIKERTGELESFAERSGAKIKNIAEGDAHARTIDTDSLLGKDGEESEVEGEVSTEEKGELPTEDAESPESEANKVETDTNDEVVGEDSAPTETEVPIEEPAEEGIEPTGEITQEEPAAKEQYIMETQRYVPVSSTPVENNAFGGLSDSELDMILEKAFGVLSPEGKVDMLIDEFIESLKG